MNWKQDSQTRHWHAEHEGHRVRLQRSRWGNSTTPAWEIYIDGKSHGKELNLSSAKLEAKRELNIMMSRSGF